MNEVHLIPYLAANLLSTLSMSKIDDIGHTVIFRTARLCSNQPRWYVNRNWTSIEWTFPTGSATLENNTGVSVNEFKRSVAQEDATYVNQKLFQAEKRFGIWCRFSRIELLAFSKEGTTATGIFELVHSDICGPMEEVATTSHSLRTKLAGFSCIFCA